MIFGREPVAWVGVIASVAIAIITTLAGQGVISDVVSGKALDLVDSIQSTVVILLPVILNYLLARPAVTPVTAPSLPQGTTVEVVTPAGQANTTKVL